jgi:hypothetical protein
VCIYCNTSKYRKIYEQHHGSIPKDENGRSYEIHHIDGDHSNNNPNNLSAVTLQEHYDIHYAQADYYACYLMLVQRMDKSHIELSNIASLNNRQRVMNKTHPFSKRADGSSITSDRVNSPDYINPFGSGETHIRYDSTVYQFYNNDTNELVSMTQREFITHYGMKSNGVSQLVTKKRKSHKGWVLYS